MNRMTTLLPGIARSHLLVDTLGTRKSDSLDFHTVSVWGMESALKEAYHQGLRDARRTDACERPDYVTLPKPVARAVRPRPDRLQLS